MKQFLFTILLLIAILIPSPHAEATASRWLTILMNDRAAPCIPLGDVLSSTTGDLDATCTDSYSGTGQTWANIETTPADSSAQTKYDWFLGDDGDVSTDDPTFTGTAGDSAAHFLYDGGDHFADVDLSGTSLNKAGMTSGAGTGPVWIAMAFKLGAVDANISFWGQETSIAGAARVLMNATENMRFQTAAGVGDNIVIIPNDTFDATTDFLVIITFDTTSAGSERRWVNTTSGSAWDTSYTPGTETTEYTGAYQIGAGGTGSFQLPNNSKVYGFYSGNEILDDTKAGTIFTHLEARHNRDYTP